MEQRLARREMMKSKLFSKNILLCMALTILSPGLSSCSYLEHESKFQTWEKCRISAERAIKKKQKRFALAMAKDSVAAAESFGDSDFRLGISLCVLGDALRANSEAEQAELAYKRAVKVLKRAEAAAHGNLKDQNKLQNMMSRLIEEDLANTFLRLSELLFEEGKKEDALKSLERAAEKFQALLMYDLEARRPGDLILQKQYLQCLVSLAKLAAEVDQQALADSAFQQAVQIANGPSCGDYERRDIRDAYLKYLQSAGRSSEATGLNADLLFSQYTADGALALAESDYTGAEVAYRNALEEASKSTFSRQRILRALYNLITVFERANKPSEVQRCSQLADDFMRSRRIRYDKDYDQIQEILANYYLLSGNPILAKVALSNQLAYRSAKYGSTSKEVCLLCALLGIAELRDKNDVKAAESYAKQAYEMIMLHRNDRTYFNAIDKTVQLMTQLRHFDEAEQLEKRLIEIKRQRHDETDVWLMGLKVNLVVIYQTFNKREKAKETIADLVKTVAKSNTEQKVAAFPYLLLLLTSCVHLKWYDEVVPVAQLGQNILHEDLKNVFPSESMKQNWLKDLATLEASTGKKF